MDAIGLGPLPAIATGRPDRTSEGQTRTGNDTRRPVEIPSPRLSPALRARKKITRIGLLHARDREPAQPLQGERAPAAIVGRLLARNRRGPEHADTWKRTVIDWLELVTTCGLICCLSIRRRATGNEGLLT